MSSIDAYGQPPVAPQARTSLTRLYMENPRLPESDHGLAAFEACCGALRALELALRDGDEAAERLLHLERAGEQLRGILTELRLAAEGEPGLLASGAILPASPSWRSPAAA
jgi:hypothetical protein